MSAKEAILYDMLKTHGFVLVRRERHEVWRNPQGLTVVLSCSPSDQHWASMAIRDLRRKLAGQTIHGRQS